MRAQGVSPSGELWSKTLLVAISSEWASADRTRRESRRSGLHPALARSMLTSSTTFLLGKALMSPVRPGGRVKPGLRCGPRSDGPALGVVATADGRMIEVAAREAGDFGRTAS